MPALFTKIRRQNRKPVPPEHRMLAVGTRLMPLTIRQNNRATRITLRIEPGGKALSMTVPVALPNHEVNAFLARHHAWLEDKLARFSYDNPLKDGGYILFRGVSHTIAHTGQLRGLTAVDMINNALCLRVSGSPDRIGARLADFFKKQAKAEFHTLANAHADAIGAPIQSISIKDTRSRWGSCTSGGKLSFSWRLMMAPPFVVDYLAAHEVAHLKHMNHGPQFWQLCRQLCPHTDKAKAWLKEHGSQLHAIDFD